MKGEVSKNAITFLVVLLLVVSVVGVGTVTFSLMNGSGISNNDIDKGTVGAYVGEPPISTGKGTVGLTVST
ncbi:MAG: hypothetical protein KKB03_04430 [Nanoarchaeota archaeon]|nr:hypothetical protein [Nanoarchaeota archaeon]MBU1135421.1 hypothetical protein [Nanoarchaeota archaeon]MBU2520460.1 hypothetical protein [Nanoarchaeota archaeon]